MKIMPFQSVSLRGAAMLLTCVAALASTARAGLMDYEPFAYTGTALNGQNGGTGWNGGWFTTTATDNLLSNDGVSLSYPVTFESPIVAPTPNGSRVSTGGLDANTSRLLSQTIDLSQDGNVRYVSALFQKNAANGGGVTNDNVLIEFRDSIGNRRFGLGIEGTNDSPWLNANGSTHAPTPVIPGATYFLVAKIMSSAAGTDSAFLKVFAASDYATQVPVAEPTTWDATLTETTAAVLDRIRLRIDAGNTADAPGQVDEIRIGDTWASVTNAGAPPSLAGDFNHDNAVDGADLALWQAAYGTTAAGDADGEGVSDGNDFLIWQRNVGASAAIAGAAAAVPEPAALALLGAAIIAMPCLRRGKNK